jgi:hypothetical protein
MRGGADAFQQPGGSADQRACAEREDVSGVTRLFANERVDGASANVASGVRIGPCMSRKGALFFHSA